MRRALLLGALVGVGAVSLVAGQPPPVGAQAKAIAATKIEKVKDNLYIVTGSGAVDMTAFSGGNTAVFITDTGVTLVDTKLAGYGPTILERVKSVTSKPITRVINTHTHGDHTGSNEFFGATVESVVQENTKANMAKMDEFKGAKAKFLPNKTYKDRLTLGSGKDQIDLYYFGRAHTNGDTFVVFKAARTMHVGDVFAWKALPYIDPDNGGSVVEAPKTMTKVIDTVKDVDTIINGHIPVSTWNDLVTFRDFNADFVTYAQNAIKAKKSLDQAAKNTRCRRSSRATRPARTRPSEARSRTWRSLTRNWARPNSEPASSRFARQCWSLESLRDSRVAC
jgi:glyoxylase-like metal-dependent hydrolase (beta-lactamase superfamily II)